LAEGERAFWAGDYVTAELTLFKVLIDDPAAVGAHFYLGRIYQLRGYRTRALTHLAAAAGADFPEAYFFIGLIDFEEKAFGESAAAYIEYLDYYNDDAAAWFNLGVTYGAAGKLGDAEDAYRRSLDANQRNVAALQNLAVLYYRQGDYGRAAFFWRRLLEIAPNDAAAYYGLGLTSFTQGDYYGAADAFNGGAALAPLDGRFFYQLGRSYYVLRNYDLAVGCYTRAYELGYDEGAVAEGLGLAYEARRLYDRALPLLKKAVELREGGAGEAVAAMGRIARARGQPGAALADFYEAATRLEDDAGVYNQIGELYLEADLASWAAEAFERAVAASPADVSFNYNLAVAYERAEPKRALAQWRRYIELAEGAAGEKRRVADAKKSLIHLQKEYGEEGR